MQIRVPAGIGDISWTYSKICNLKEDIDWYISDDEPQRSLQYVLLLPNTKGARYQHFNFHNVAEHSLPYNMTKENLLTLSRQSIQNLSPNRWLEQGNKLADFMPELYTEYRYEILRPLHDIAIVNNIMEDVKNPIGIYTSSYESNAVWNGWTARNWVTLINEIAKNIDDATFILIGAAWDLQYVNDLQKQLPNIKLINVCGQTPIAQTIEIISRLKYLISYPSGIAILSNVLNTPVMMFYPQHLEKLMNAWPDPQSIEDGSYKGCIFPKPHQAIDYLLNTYGLREKIQGGLP